MEEVLRDWATHWRSVDGRLFDNKEKCAAYERETSAASLFCRWFDQPQFIEDLEYAEAILSDWAGFRAFLDKLEKLKGLK